MEQTVNLYQFRDAFQRMDRADAFTYEGLEVLFRGLEEFEEDTNEEMELDVIALCCDFVEMCTDEVVQSYKHMMDEEQLQGAKALKYIEEWLNNQTWVLGETSLKTYVFRQF